MEKITNYSYNIQDAFSNLFYIIPDFQREYVWQDTQIIQLLDDINSEFETAKDSQYFIGNTIVSKSSDGKSKEVIDGQQRLTTLFLILCALKTKLREYIPDELISRNYINSEGKVEKAHKVKLKYDGAEEILKTIIEVLDKPEAVRNSLETQNIKLYGSLENIVNAYEYIYQYLEENFKEQQELLTFWGYLANNVIFIQLETDIGSALKIFETINERGVGLNPMDLLKNLLFTQIKQDNFEKLKNEWKKITSKLEQHKEKPLRFLRYFLMANYKINNERKDNILREDEIYKWITKEENARMCGYQGNPFEFVRKIINFTDIYINFSMGRDKAGNDNVYLDNIRKLCGGGFSLHFILLLACCNLPAELFNYFVQQIESFLFYYIITKTPTKELERKFSLWADELREIANNTDKIQQELQLYEFVNNHFKSGVEAKKEEFEDVFKRFASYSLQKYRIRYLLAKLTQYVDMQYQGQSKPDKLDYYIKQDIEHILPSSPQEELRLYIEENYPEGYYSYNLKLGNLTYLEKPINIVAGRKFFEEKKPLYAQSKNYLTSSISIKNTVGNNSSINRVNEKLLSFGDWNPEAIEQRQNMLYELAKEIWSIKVKEASNV